MKKWTSALIVGALFLPADALGQHSSKAAEAGPASARIPRSSTKAVTIAGQVSADGKTLVSKEDEIWTVRNSNVLASHEGQQVIVKCQVHPYKNEIDVLTVRVELPEVKSASAKEDSAFRR